MLANLLLEINKLHTKDLADLALKLEEFADNDEATTLKEKFLRLERNPTTTQSPRLPEDENELKVAQKLYYDLLIHIGLTDKVKNILYSLASIAKTTREAVHHAKYANNKDDVVITAEDITTAWLNQIPTDDINLPSICAKLTILANIFKGYILPKNIDDHFKTLFALEGYVKQAYQEASAIRFQEKRTEILKAQEIELTKLPEEETLATQYSNCRKLRTYMDRQLKNSIKELNATIELHKSLLEKFELTLEKNEVEKLEKEIALLEKNRTRLEKEIECGKVVLEKHDHMVEAQKITLKAIKLIKISTEEALKQVDPIVEEVTAASEKKFKILLDKKKSERNISIIEKGKSLYAAQKAKEFQSSLSQLGNLDDLPTPGFTLHSSRGSSDGSTSPKSLLRSFSGRILGINPPPLLRTRTPGQESPKRSSSNLMLQRPESPQRNTSTISKLSFLAPAANAPAKEDMPNEPLASPTAEARQ